MKTVVTKRERAIKAVEVEKVLEIAKGREVEVVAGKGGDSVRYAETSLRDGVRSYGDSLGCAQPNKSQSDGSCFSFGCYKGLEAHRHMESKKMCYLSNPNTEKGRRNLKKANYARAKEIRG